MLTLLMSGCSKNTEFNITPPISTLAPEQINLMEGDFSLKIISPLDGQVFSSQIIEVKGETLPRAVVTINDLIIISDDDGNFEVKLTVSEGLNIIVIEASNAEGDSLIAQLTVDVDLER